MTTWSATASGFCSALASRPSHHCPLPRNLANKSKGELQSRHDHDPCLSGHRDALIASLERRRHSPSAPRPRPPSKTGEEE